MFLQLYHKLQLQHQPVLCANLLDELKCALAPEEVFLLVLQNAQQRAIVHRQTPQRVEEIFIGFIRLLPRYFAEHHDIPFYADQLHISPVYLSRVVRQVTGRTVVDYINQMLLMEATFLLQTSQLSITQIADHLHFADTPSFSKFFSRLSGMSPKEYRKG